MQNDLPEVLPQGTGIISSRLSLSDSPMPKPVSDTVRMPEPSFAEVKHLMSDKPLRFFRPPKLP